MILSDSLQIESLLLGNFGASGPIGTAGATVDRFACFFIAQTTPSITLTIPIPGIVGNSRQIILHNTGSATVTINSVSVAAGRFIIVKWDGTGWRNIPAPSLSPVSQLVFTTSGNYTPSLGVKAIIVEMAGGGGGGGGIANVPVGSCCSAAGGNSGAYVRAFVTAAQLVAYGSPVPFVVGAAGSAGLAGGGSSGGSGGGTAFGAASQLEAKGGLGGPGNNLANNLNRIQLSSGITAGFTVTPGQALNMGSMNGTRGGFGYSTVTRPYSGGKGGTHKLGNCPWRGLRVAAGVNTALYNGTGFGVGGNGQAATGPSGGAAAGFAGRQGVIIITEFF